MAVFTFIIGIIIGLFLGVLLTSLVVVNGRYENKIDSNISEGKNMIEIVQEENEEVSHPSHYCDGRNYEPKDVIHDWGLDFFLGSAIKYIARAGRKPGNSKKQDLRKAIQYLEFEIEKESERKL